MTDDFRNVFANVLGIDPAALEPSSSPDTIPEWDSLTHVTLMMALEAEHGVQFDPMDLMELRTAGDVYARIRELSGLSQP